MLLLKAADFLARSDIKLRQGGFMFGFVEKDRPAEGKSWGKPHEVYPWDSAIIQVVSCSALGAICHVAQATTSDPAVVQAHTACVRFLNIPYSLEVWNDIEGRTKDDVINLFRNVGLQP